MSGIGGSCKIDPYTEPEAWVAEMLDSLASQARDTRREDTFRPLCLEFGAYGVHFTDRILGAQVYFDNNQWWTQPLQTEIGQLAVPDLETNETWLLERSIARAFLDHQVTVPVFGMPVIAGALTVAVSIYGAHFLEAMLTQPNAAQHDLRIINDLTCQLYQWYFDNIPAQQLQQVQAATRCMPPGHISIYGCTSHLISQQMYRDHVAPLDEEVLAKSTHGGLIHLCGEHCQHIETWRDMPSLRAVQINDRASEDLAQYYEGLREDQLIYLHTTDTMTAESALQITGGRRIVIHG